MHKMKLALGTAQFGMDYGATNSSGQIPEQAVEQMLAEAQSAGIDVLDTAALYGNAEQILGRVQACNRFRVITKIRPGSANAVKTHVRRSAERLNTKVLDTVLLHSFSEWTQDPPIWCRMAESIEDGLVRRIGLSLYHPHEWIKFARWLESEPSRRSPDLLQFPLSVFDQRFSSVLVGLKARGIELHVRSVFLQGIGFADPMNIPLGLYSLKPSIERLVEIETQTGLSRLAVLLLFPGSFEEIDRIIIGTDSYKNLRDTIATWKDVERHVGSQQVRRFLECSVSDENTILPMNWRS